MGGDWEAAAEVDSLVGGGGGGGAERCRYSARFFLISSSEEECGDVVFVCFLSLALTSLK